MGKNFKILVFILIVFAFIFMGWNLSTGVISLSINDFFEANSQNHQIAGLRLNRMIVMFLAGVSIPSSGFLLQEYFQNPLAGPSVLGITSVSGLMVAFFILLSQDFTIPDFLQNSMISVFSILGSLLMMFVIMAFSKWFSDKAFLIIFGFLISALAGAIVSILQFYADNQSVKNYILWSFGANTMVSKNQIFILIFLIILGLIFSFTAIKPLIGNSLGENYAKSLGVNLTHLKFLIIISSSLLAASTTAFLGPILFIGIIVPHFCRMLYNPTKLWQQWILNMILGIIIMEFFSVISEISKFPVNVITSLFGIPVILLMLIKTKKHA